MRKLSRTISGVTPVAVMTRPSGCPGRCVYCPTYGATPQSYTPESPAVIRARGCDYDAFRQVQRRLNVLADMGHPTDKVELIIMGGTFLAIPIEYQYQFVKDCYDAMNGVISSSLVEAQKLNETAARHCVGLCVETRPDVCGEAEVSRMIEFGTTRVELGVQALDDRIYAEVQRGHSVADVARATAILKRSGLKVHYHWMPGLPGSSPEHDLEMSRELFDNPDYRPDGLKLYPTMVVEGTILEQWFKEGRYQPYANDVMVNLMADIKSIVPEYVRISRVLRDIPARYIVGGLKESVRSTVKEVMAARGDDCRCIRCREYGHRIKTGWKVGQPRLSRLDYEAAHGREIFLSFEDEHETLFGLLRLRIEPEPIKSLGVKSPLALVRELHVFGSELALGKREDKAAQHHGLGRALLAEAERIAVEEFGASLVAVLSGVGARQYYAELGYEFNSGYMTKNL
ncbi:MAG: tRNA uridine(34) 5-carboxymethylaminomethyl modification radical SAM/GNAT enzyme Elp3 [Dehalococcoidia bacterium]|nr:MAG: tRNA uridine(34) 5-carboxymethylaminomethyl modification radical SAM/GNAT enzyme Elp3 [Dehalococcoidia bacterium]